MNTILDIPTGELAVRSPGASRVFHRHGIDYCCGGKRPLRDSCSAAGADPETVMRELIAAENTSQDKAQRWDTRPLSELLTHLQRAFHEQLLPELPRLRFMAQKVAKVHGGHQPAMVELATIVTQLADETESHLEKEERILFPWILGGQGNSAHVPITGLQHEHDAQVGYLANIRRLCGGFQPWTGACNTVRALYLGLENLERELIDHIHLENNVLFPRALVDETCP